MGLITKPPSWRTCTTNLTGTPTSGALGTAVTAGANNADGSSVSLIAALAHDVEMLGLCPNGFFALGANSSTLIDILIDPAGGSSWSSTPLINDLLGGFCAAAGGAAAAERGWSHQYFFPLWIPAGASIGARARTAHTANITGRLAAFAYGANANPGSWWCGQSVTTLGATAASSKGTDHTPGNTGSYSSWADLGSTLPSACGALQFGVHGTNSDTTMNGAVYFFEFGVGSERIGPNVVKGTSTSETSWTGPQGPLFHSLPEGAQLQVRGTCSATAEVIDVAAYVVH